MQGGDWYHCTPLPITLSHSLWDRELQLAMVFTLYRLCVELLLSHASPCRVYICVGVRKYKGIASHIYQLLCKGTYISITLYTSPTIYTVGYSLDLGIKLHTDLTFARNKMHLQTRMYTNVHLQCFVFFF